MKKVYIERKYNTKLAYQMHTIMQAKRIEDEKEKLKKELNKSHESPLIRNVLKVIQNSSRKTDRKTQEKDKIFNNSIVKKQEEDDPTS